MPRVRENKITEKPSKKDLCATPAQILKTSTHKTFLIRLKQTSEVPKVKGAHFCHKKKGKKLVNQVVKVTMTGLIAQYIMTQTEAMD